MGRVINPDSAGKERRQLVRAVAVALREMMRQPRMDGMTRDLAAFIALSLLTIDGTIDASVAAWEKRGYWVKADRFRRDWAWSKTLGDRLHKALLGDDWAMVAVTAAHIGEQLREVKVSEKHRLGAPWVGAWQRMVGKR